MVWFVLLTVLAVSVVLAGPALASTAWMAVLVALLIAAGMLAMRRLRMR